MLRTLLSAIGLLIVVIPRSIVDSAETLAFYRFDISV